MTDTAAEIRCRCCDHVVKRNGNDWRCKHGCGCTMRGCVLDGKSRRMVEYRRPSRVNTVRITPQYRADSGDLGAWDEAVDQLRLEYTAICHGWAGNTEQPTLRLVLEMERP